MDQQQQEFEEPEQYGIEDPPPDQEEKKEPETLAHPAPDAADMQQQPDVEPRSDNAEQPDAPVQDPALLRRSTRDRNPVQRLDPKMSGKRHAEVTLPMVDTNAEIVPDWDRVTFKCMTQLSMKAGLKRFGKEGEDGVSKELNQLHLRETFEPVVSSQLPPEERTSVIIPACNQVATAECTMLLLCVERKEFEGDFDEYDARMNVS